jgi:pimeloyl-ACP methyl ester carboxylesterase
MTRLSVKTQRRRTIQSLNKTSISNRTLRPLLLAAALYTGLVTLPAFANNQVPAVPTIQWGSCGDGITGLDCATVKVPLDYDHPNGPKTDIALARVPAADPANKIGTLFLNPGGPGGSGVDLVSFGFGDFLNQTLLGKFDIVGWDPRGIGGSTPIQCWDSNAARNRYFGDSPIFPYKARQERPFYELNRNIANLCFGRDQAIVRHMSTADVVRDLDLLRQAVGDQRLTYLGYSYGSHIGNTYANMFPSKVRALVIDGVLNPILWTSGWQIQADRTASFDVLKQFFKLCDRAGDQCGLSGPSGSKVRFDQLLDFVRDTPILLDDGQGGIFEYSYDFFVADSAGVMYSPEQWGGYADFLGLLSDAIQGDATAAKRALQKRRSIEEAIRNAAPTRAPYNNGIEAYLGNQCSDTEYPSIFPFFSAIARYAEAGSFQGPFWWWGNAGCAAWPTAPDRYVGPWTARTSAPVLVVGNLFDPATDYAGAVASNRLLPNSRLLSYAGWGHTASYSGRSACTDDYVSLYLLDGSLPPKGTVCPAAANPFVTAAVNARSAKPMVMPMTGMPTLKPLPVR